MFTCPAAGGQRGYFDKHTVGIVKEYLFHPIAIIKVSKLSYVIVHNFLRLVISLLLLTIKLFAKLLLLTGNHSTFK